jgi:DNA-binding NtrC family response regulator/tetratricopeptide (TPR) repeat protein
MAADSLRLATDHFRAGRFRDAIAVLRRAGPPTNSRNLSLYRVLLAEALERSGGREEATALARAVLAERRPDPALHARCHGVLGLIASRENASAQAFRHFQRAIRLASQAQDEELIVRSQLRLLANLGDGMSAAAVSTLVSDIKKRVASIRDTELFATLHLEVARIEARRGQFRLAKRHLQEATALTAGLANAWFKGRLNLQASGLAFLSSAPLDAVHHAEEALRCAERCGDEQMKTAAILNIAAAHLAGGNLEEAHSKLVEALGLTSDAAHLRIGVLLNMAVLRILEGRPSESQSLLEEVSRLHGGPPSWWSFWIDEARIWLLRELEDWRAVRECAQNAIATATDSHQYATAPLLLFDAEAAVELGEPPPASLSVTRLDAAELPLGSRAELERIRGKAFGIAGDLARAAKHLAAATRISVATGDFAAFRRASIDLARLARRPSTEAQIRNAWAAMREPRQIGAGPVLLAAETPGEKPVAPQVEPCEIALLHHLAASPQAYAFEAFDLLARSGAAEVVVLTATRPGASPEVVAAYGCHADQARVYAHELPCQDRLLLCEADGWRWELGATAKGALSAGCLFAALWQLIDWLSDYHRLREREQYRDALWPGDLGSESWSGIRTAESTREIWAIARKIADTNLPVLITGETGTGKEVLARAIHQFSRRAARPFVAFNCKAVPRELLDSHLFGYRRGAFTGAYETFPGMVRAAAGGTLFLDEIGDLERDLQPKLLRFLETDEILPLGATHPVRADVRVIAATNANLEQAVADGRFREDLYYRLNVIHFHLPPLRERREEIPSLIRYFVRRHGEPAGKGNLPISDEALEYLLLYHWPGNVRQLENEVRRFVALAEPNSLVTAETLSPTIRASRRTLPAVEAAEGGGPPRIELRLDQPLASAVRQLEVAMIAHALRTAEGRVEQAARLLGVSRKGLFLKRRRLGFAAERPTPA